jgi:hypothetical protein
MSFDLSDYEPVEDRLAKFWTDHSNGRVATELSHRDDREYVFRAALYRDLADELPFATGYAQEIVGSTPVNKTSALENCETSALGRALANAGYAPKGKRASREEMAKAQRRTESPTWEKGRPANPAERGRSGNDERWQTPDADAQPYMLMASKAGSDDDLRSVRDQAEQAGKLRTAVIDPDGQPTTVLDYLLARRTELAETARASA